MIFGVQLRHSNLRVKTWQACWIWAVTFYTDIPSIVDWLGRTKPCRSEDSRCPPKRGLVYCCCVSSGLASQVALLAALTSHVMLDSKRDEYIYTALRTMDDYIFFIFTSFTSFTSIKNSNPNRNQRSSNLQTLPSFCYIKLSFCRSSHPSYLISRTTTSCRRIAPTASTAFKIALPLAQNAPLREPLTVTSPTLVPMYSLPQSLPFSLSFSSSKASNGSLGLTWLPWALGAWVKLLVQQLPWHLHYQRLANQIEKAARGELSWTTTRGHKSASICKFAALSLLL